MRSRVEALYAVIQLSDRVGRRLNKKYVPHFNRDDTQQDVSCTALAPPLVSLKRRAQDGCRSPFKETAAEGGAPAES